MNKKRIIIIGIIVLAIVAASYVIKESFNKRIEVSVIEVKETNIVKTVDIAGNVYANDSQEIRIPEGIKVEEVYFAENDLVSNGDILAVLDTTDLDLRLKKAQITLAQIEADIKNSGSKLAGVDQGILLNNIDKASESYKRAKSDLEFAREKLADLKVLFENSAISESEFKNQVSLVDNLEINLKTADLNVKDAELRYSNYLDQSLDTKSSLTRQRQTVLLDIQGIKDDIDSSVIKSEISGVMINFKLKKDRKTSNNELVQIQDPDSFKFKAMVPQEDSVFIKENQKAYVTIAGVSGNYNGLVSSIAKNASVDQSSGSSTPKVEITIDLLDEDKSFISGFDADAIIETGLVENTPALNNEAIKKNEDGNHFVYLVNSNNKAKKTSIETGLSDGYKTQIISGIELMDKVVSNPPMELIDGSKLKIK